MQQGLDRAEDWGEAGALSERGLPAWTCCRRLRQDSKLVDVLHEYYRTGPRTGRTESGWSWLSPGHQQVGGRMWDAGFMAFSRVVGRQFRFFPVCQLLSQLPSTARNFDKIAYQCS